MTSLNDQLRALHDGHSKQVFAAALVAAGGRDDVAKDAVQHAFIEAWKTLSDPQRPQVRAWRSWLYRVAVRQVFEDLNGKQRNDVSLNEFDTACDVPSYDHHMVIKDEYITVLNKIARMPLRRRQAMALTHIAGYTTKEVADAMGLNPSAVRNLIHLARRDLDERGAES